MINENLKLLNDSKKDGGLGFKDIEGFNISLLGKQLWRLATKKDSLLARVLKEKYYPNSSPLEASIGHRPSFGWRSIHSAQVLMKLGMKKEFGNGDDMNFLQDPWLATDPPRPPLQNPGYEPKSFILQYFKDQFSYQWNLGRLSSCFSTTEAALILQIKPGGESSASEFSWIHNKTGSYTVKSGYWIWQHRIKFKEEVNMVLQPSLHSLSKEIWQTKAPPKINHFLWRCLNDCLGIGKKMKQKKLTKNGDCPRCPNVIETVNHLLFECLFARVVWALSPLGHLFYPGANSSLFENLSSLLLQRYQNKGRTEEKERFTKWPWILWLIWKRRNDLVYSGLDCNAEDLLTQAREAAEEWLKVNTTTVSSSPSSSPLQRNKNWLPPESGYLKCNIDGSWIKGSSKSGIGWILRDSEGKVKKYGAKCYPRLLSPLHTEATTLVWAVSCSVTQGYNNVCFESDCHDLIKAIHHPEDWPCLHSFTSEIISLSSFVSGFCFRFSPRESNKCADAMAKHVIASPVYFGILDVAPPSWLQTIADSDVSSVVTNSIN